MRTKVLDASMGPAFENAGYVEHAEKDPEGTSCFNGSSVRERRLCEGPCSTCRRPCTRFNGSSVRERRLCMKTLKQAGINELQWVQRSRTPVMVDLIDAPLERIAASMGPAFENAGYASYHTPAHERRGQLQWVQRSRTPVMWHAVDTGAGPAISFNGSSVRERRLWRAVRPRVSQVGLLQWVQRSRTPVMLSQTKRLNGII